MPKHKTVNRREVDSILIKKNLFVSETAVEEINVLSAALQVTQGSITDSALRYFGTLPQAQVIELLRDYGHLTDGEYKYVLSHVQKLK